MSADFNARLAAALDGPGDFFQRLAELHQDMEERVAAMLARLPLSEAGQAAIMDEAGYLVDVCSTADALDAPLERRGGTRAAARELGKLRNHLVAVSRSLGEMSAPSRAALDAAYWADHENAKEDGHRSGDGTAPHRLGFGFDALALAEAAEAARRAMLAGLSPTMGRPKKNAASTVTDEAINVYENLTGTPATLGTNSSTNKAYGPLLDMVADLFAAFGIEASAEAQVRAALARRKHQAETKTPT